MKNNLKTVFSRVLLGITVILFTACHSDDPAPNPNPGPDPEPNPVTGNILMFISKDQTYYSEYKISLEALQAAGYTVDVRSAGEGTASVYTLSGDIDDVNNQTAGATYNDFTAQFQASFGAPWNAAWNATPATVPLDGNIQDVDGMAAYDALVIPGGTGANAYRMDDDYADQGDVTAEEVQAAAEKLNDLAIEALMAGKPVMALCHGASLPAFFKVPGTANSLLEGQEATGYPEPETAVTLSDLGVNFRAEDRVTVTSPNPAFNDNGMGDYKLATTRDWYTQSVTYAMRTLLNMMRTYPSQAQMENNISVLILHGGAVDPGNCGAGNKANDIPCNYGGGADLPADFTSISDLLTANSPADNYNISVDEMNLFNTTPTYDDLVQYDVVVFFKHWSSGVTTALQNALIDYADNGGGVIGLHHAVYNEPEGPLNKDILTEQLFSVESAPGVGLVLTNYSMVSTNYGHFISTYGINLAGDNPAMVTPDPWFSNFPSSAANLSYSYYQNFGIYDEVYANMMFTGGQTFGRGVNQVTPLFSNNLPVATAPASQLHTSGFVKLFDPSGDGSMGRVVFLQPGERRENFTVNHRYGQVIRNAVVWAAYGN